MASINDYKSVIDEIKGFKELLDMGAITQAEFDVKKKQLLESGTTLKVGENILTPQLNDDQQVFENKSYILVRDEDGEPLLDKDQKKKRALKWVVISLAVAFAVSMIVETFREEPSVDVIFDAGIYAGVYTETLYEMVPNLEFYEEQLLFFDNFGNTRVKVYSSESASGYFEFIIAEDRVVMLSYEPIVPIQYTTAESVIKMFGITPSDKMEMLESWEPVKVFERVSDEVSRFGVFQMGSAEKRFVAVGIFFDSEFCGSFASDPY